MHFVVLGPILLAAQLSTAPKDVTLENGSVVRVEAGELQVPESRKRPSERRVTLPYYRLRSESKTPAPPIFLLAGGPGSSWIDQFKADETFQEVAFYRTIADVVLFDQRGAGHARPAMTCTETAPLPEQPFNPANARAAMRAAATACRDRWLREGVDLAAYNTVENAADVNDLRQALGYDKIILVGGSYGSHLALQVMRQFPRIVDRVVMFGIEGPDHTWDNASGHVATLGRIAKATEESAAFAGRVPSGGFLAALERVIARLESSPQTVTVGNGANARTVVVNADLVRLQARREAGRRTQAHLWPEMILALERGDYSLVARAAGRRELAVAPPMHHSIDCASGISDARRKRYANDPARALLGNINLEYEAICEIWPAEDLGPTFRQPVVSDIPTVIAHGTWDMSTPIENAREVATTLRNGHLIEVVAGNHGALYNLFRRWPPIYPMLREFLTGHAVDFPDTVSDMNGITFAPPAAR